MSCDVTKLYRLAMLDGNNGNIEKEINQLTAFADTYASNSSAPKARNICGITDVLRPDTVKDSYDRDSILAQAPVKKDGMILVPVAIKKP